MTNFGEERYPTKLKVTLVKGLIGRVPKHRRTVRALGLRKMNQVVWHDDNPVIRGMIKEVEYLLEVERVLVEGSVPSPLAGEGQGEGGKNDVDR